MMIFVLALTSALAVSGAFVSRQVAANSRGAERGAALEPLAEASLVMAVSAWDSLARGSQPIGSTELITDSTATDVRVQLWITRLSAREYWLTAEARTATRPRIGRRLALVVDLTNGVATPISGRAWAELP